MFTSGGKDSGSQSGGSNSNKDSDSKLQTGSMTDTKPVDSININPSPTNSNPPSAPTPKPAPATAPTEASSQLMNLKQRALGELSPLVESLDQPPKEHFRTLMMVIQATDNSSLIERALNTAKKIDDNRERAQAMLDVVNEINYFTQNNPKS